MSWVWINGQWADGEQPVISAKDRGVLYGDGLFETLRVYGGKVFQLAEHWARLSASASFLRIPLPWSLDDIRPVAAGLIERNGQAEAAMRITLTRGAASPGLDLSGPASPTLIFQLREWRPYPESLYRRGADLVIARVRQNADSPLSRHKTTNYLIYLLARQEARDAKADDALMLNQSGQVCETSVANVFCVKEGRLGTPPCHCGVLPGITRANVLRLALRDGIPVEERPILAGEMFERDEVFVTNTLMEIAPVRRIDGARVGDAVPGPVTALLMAAYRDRASWAAV